MNVKSPRLYHIYAAPAFIIIISLVLGSGLLVTLTPLLAVGILYDLTLLSPLIYLLLIWKRDIPKITTVPVFIIGLVVATWLLPVDTTHYLTIRNVVLPLVELTVLGFVTFQAVRAVRVYKTVSAGEADFLSAFRKSALELIPNRKVAEIFTTEAGMLYYALFAWGFASSAPGYSGYRRSGSLALYTVLTFLILAETIVLHIVLIRWNPAIAWVLFSLSMYSALQLIAHLKALIMRRSYFSDSAIHLRCGLMGDVTIPVTAIASVEVSGRELSGIPGSAKLSVLGDLEPHNLILHLHAPAHIRGPYGMVRSATCLGIFIDNRADFAEEVVRLKQDGS